MSIYGKNHYNIVISLQLIKKNGKIKKKITGLFTICKLRSLQTSDVYNKQACTQACDITPLPPFDKVPSARGEGLGRGS